MKPKKFISALIVSSLTLATLSSCANSQSIGAQVGKSESLLGKYEELAQEDMPAYYQFLEELPLEDTAMVLAYPEKYEPKALAKAGYDNLKDKNIDITDESVKKELENVVIGSTYPTDLTEEEFTSAVGILASTLESSQNPFICYYPLAIGAHLSVCNEEHIINDFNIVECPVLKKAFTSVCPITLEEFMTQNFADDEAYLRIKEASYTNDNLEVYINELENLVQLSINPTDIYDDELWQKLFGHLDATLASDENLYETYITLAIKVHNLIYLDDVLEVPQLARN